MQQLSLKNIGRLDFGNRLFFFDGQIIYGLQKHQFTVKKSGKRFQRFTDTFSQLLMPQSAKKV